MAELRDKVKEIADIAASLPENLQPPCFELLLKHYLASLATKAPPPPGVGGHADVGTGQAPKPDEKIFAETTKVQADLSNNDLHVKVRRFLDKYNISLAELNNLFYKEGENIFPLYEDLKTTRTSEAQTRVALLQSLLNALKTGDFQTTVETIRGECNDRKYYDMNNFATNFNNNKSLYDFDKYTKGTKEVRLSEDGRKELSQLIKELQ